MPVIDIAKKSVRKSRPDAFEKGPKSVRTQGSPRFFDSRTARKKSEIETAPKPAQKENLTFCVSIRLMHATKNLTIEKKLTGYCEPTIGVYIDFSLRPR
jgi:hypothetical protein